MMAGMMAATARVMMKMTDGAEADAEEEGNSNSSDMPYRKRPKIAPISARISPWMNIMTGVSKPVQSNAIIIKKP